MRTELLFHVVFSLCCLEVRFILYCRKKNDQSNNCYKIFVGNLSEALVQDSEDIDTYGLVESEGSDWDHSQIGSYSSEFKLENKEPEDPEEEAHEALEKDQVPGPGK